MSEEFDCSEVYKKPSCPYVTQININTCDMKDIKRALLGEDGTGLKGGVVFEISQLKGADKVVSTWISTTRPILVAVVSSVLRIGLLVTPGRSYFKVFLSGYYK
jgi:hypothetical protein